jgi:hypothetical protein
VCFDFQIVGQGFWWIMRLSKAVVSATAATVATTWTMTTSVVVSAYTFDPLNNMWKPSGAKNAATHRSNSFSSSYAPHLSELEGPPVVQGDDVIRAQYSKWAGYYHNGVNKNHGESLQQQSLVQIEYNKRTGEVSLVDHDGIVTKEEYRNLMRAINMGNANDGDLMESSNARLDLVDEHVILGTTHVVDGEDIDPNDVIDTSSETEHLNAEAGRTNAQSHKFVPSPRYSMEYNQQSISEQQHYHHHEEQLQEVAPTEAFQTYSVPKRLGQVQTQLQEQQYHQLQHIQLQQHYQQHGHSMNDFQPQPQGHPVQATEKKEHLPETIAQNGGWGFNDRRTTFIK